MGCSHCVHNQYSGTDLAVHLLCKYMLMERSIVMQTNEDADSLFLIAKDRLLDVNEWGNILSFNTTLTDTHGQKVHRDAHMGDLVKAEVSDGLFWAHIDNILYDKYPDDNAEELSINLVNTVPPSGADKLSESVKLTGKLSIRRVKSVVTAIYDNIEYNGDIMPREKMEHLLSSFIAIDEYEVQ